VNFDPPSKSVSEAKLQQNRRSCDGMVAVLTWRSTGPSKYILFEIELALRSQMPVVAFIDDRLANNVLPSRVLQQRFSHRTYFRQVREHTHALHVLKSHIGDPPPVRYQSNFGQRCCATLGWRRLPPEKRRAATDYIAKRGYRLLDLDAIEPGNTLTFSHFEAFAATDVVVSWADAGSSTSQYWAGAAFAAGVPQISFTLDTQYAFHRDVPQEFQPGLVDRGEATSLEEFLSQQFDLFEQNFLSAQGADVIERYVRMQVQAGVLAGNYEAGTRQVFIGAIMGDQYNVSGQTAGVGPNAHVHDVTFSQVWSQLASQIDLATLANELKRLRESMSAGAAEPEQLAAVGNVAAAEACARQGNGPKTIEYLRAAGKWTLGVAEKIGVELAKDAIKGALGM